MRSHTMQILITLGLLSMSANTVHANDPDTNTPWPVGSTEEQMDSTKTLMSCYGDPVNGWGTFHAGIDIDENTEEENGDYVRNVQAGVIKRILYNTLEDEYTVVTAPTVSSDNGWHYGHLCNPNDYGWFYENQPINQGDLIAEMDSVSATTIHTHFAWVNVYNVEVALVNPLDYLEAEPEGSDYWEFNPDGLTPPFEHMFLPDACPWEWSGWTLEEAQEKIIPDDSLYGNIDFFFGVSLQGEGQGEVCSYTEDCVPERVYWELIQETASSGTQVLEEKYLMNFDCALSSEENNEIAKLLYFKWFMGNMFGKNGVLMCLTNCGDMQTWEGLGLDNIEEDWWDTDRDYLYPHSNNTNPVLAEYRDGPLERLT